MSCQFGRETRASAGLATALQGALALGNFLNWGGRLGAASGFRLKNLPKLQARWQPSQQACNPNATWGPWPCYRRRPSIAL